MRGPPAGRAVPVPGPGGAGCGRCPGTAAPARAGGARGRSAVPPPPLPRSQLSGGGAAGAPRPGDGGPAHPAPGQAGSAPPARAAPAPPRTRRPRTSPAPSPAEVPRPARHGAAPLTCRPRRVPRAALGSGRRGRALPPLASNSLQGYGHYGAGRRVSRQLLLPRPRASPPGPAPRGRVQRFSASHWCSACPSSGGAGRIAGGPMALRRGRGQRLARCLAPRRGAGRARDARARGGGERGGRGGGAGARRGDFTSINQPPNKLKKKKR